MAYRGDDPYGDPNSQPDQSWDPNVHATPDAPDISNQVKTYIGTDANGVAIYQGTDGQLYTDGDGPNGFVSYSGPGPAGAAESPGPQAPPQGPGGGVGGTGGGDPFGGSLTAPFTGTFTPPTGGPDLSWLPNIPEFHAPQYTPPPAFAAPKGEDVFNEPGYAFRSGEGQRALEQSAAGRGVLNTGGTLKDLIKYGQDFASNEYGNVYNRALSTYGTNLGSQYIDPYKFKYQAAMDEFSPKLLDYSTRAAAGQRGTENDYNNAWNQYMQSYNQYRNQQSDVFDKLFRTSQLGLQANG